jgi:hypothetical protein
MILETMQGRRRSGKSFLVCGRIYINMINNTSETPQPPQGGAKTWFYLDFGAELKEK